MVLVTLLMVKLVVTLVLLCREIGIGSALVVGDIGCWLVVDDIG